MPEGLEAIVNFRKVNDRLSTAGQPSEEQLHAVANAGFEVIINLAPHDDPRYALPDESGLVQSLGLTYVHIPVPFAEPSEDQLKAFFEAMDAHQHRRVFVHCAANKRVSAFLGLYNVLCGESAESAFALMRDLWTPNPVWAAFIESMLGKSKI